MKFRSLLTDPSGQQSRPVQAFHNTTHAAWEWAEAQLKTASPLAYVTLYVELEVEVWQWKQTARPATTAPLQAPIPEVPPRG